MKKPAMLFRRMQQKLLKRSLISICTTGKPKCKNSLKMRDPVSHGAQWLQPLRISSNKSGKIRNNALVNYFTNSVLP